MKYILGLVILVSVFCSRCTKDNWGTIINPNDSLSFGGAFATAAYYGQVALYIDNGRYECNTNLPYGKSAGKLIADETTLDFIDTLFIPEPAVYGPSFTLSGKYVYLFDGNILIIQKNVNGGKIKYELKLMKSY